MLNGVQGAGCHKVLGIEFKFLQFFFEKVTFFYQGHNQVENISKTKHKNDYIHRHCDCVCNIQNKKQSVVSQIANQRVDHVVFCVSKTNKNVVGYCAQCVGNVEREQFESNFENCLVVFQPGDRHDLSRSRPCS